MSFFCNQLFIYFVLIVNYLFSIDSVLLIFIKYLEFIC